MRPSRSAKWCLVLSLAGIGVAGYLGFLHLALLRGELIGGAACSAAGTFWNCHAVTASPIGMFLGLPLAFLGVVGYLATFTLALIAWQFPESTTHALTGLL